MLNKLIGATLLSLMPALAFADSPDLPGDPKKGERVFRKCKACHDLGADAVNKSGPILTGIIGRPIASIDGFAYSDVLSALGAEGKTWTPDDLAAFLEKPRDYAKGTKMTFVGLRKEADRNNVIAYLAQHPGE